MVSSLMNQHKLFPPISHLVDWIIVPKINCQQFKITIEITVKLKFLLKMRDFTGPTDQRRRRKYLRETILVPVKFLIFSKFFCDEGMFFFANVLSERLDYNCLQNKPPLIKIKITSIIVKANILGD
jgi:hypothetical protein